MTALAPKGLAFGLAHHCTWPCGWYIKPQLFGLGAKKTTFFCFFTSLSVYQKKSKSYEGRIVRVSADG